MSHSVCWGNNSQFDLGRSQPRTDRALDSQMSEYINRSAGELYKSGNASWTESQRVRSDLAQMYRNYKSPNEGLLSNGVAYHAGNPRHATLMSNAMQRMERMAGNDGDFAVQANIDMAQQHYDQVANRRTWGEARSSDHDGRQNYDANPNVAFAQRAAKHRPNNLGAAVEQSSYLQQREEEAVGNFRFRDGDYIDRLQENRDLRNGIAGSVFSGDRDGFGRSASDHVRGAMNLFSLLGLFF